MATNKFKKILIDAKPEAEYLLNTLESLLNILNKQNCEVFCLPQTSKLINEPYGINIIEKIDQTSIDLAIVVGGDGSLLNLARKIIKYNIPAVGINRGGLGFLTDIHPKQLAENIPTILAGNYSEQKRFLLNIDIMRNNNLFAQSTALNDCVLNTGSIARMIEFEVYISDQFVYSQRSDGLIISTPTGSTAYSLSGGGPIMHPSLDTIVLVPMFPHTLSSRPIVVNSKEKIVIKVSEHNEINPTIACDGQVHVSMQPKDEVIISRHPQELTLIHPPSHDYYNVLRTKLGWGTKLL